MKINGKNYTLPEMNFKTMCDLEDYGASLTTMSDKPMKTVLAFAAMAIGNEVIAAKEIEAHLINGGSLEELIKEIREALTNSGFFQALSQRTAEGDGESKEKESPQKAE